ncbi:MAG: hypothetical protein RIA64_01515 [Rhodospirillales bacterium]
MSIEQQMLQRMSEVLTPEEFRILDQAITPEVGAVVLKAFPDLAPVIQVLTQNDPQGQQQVPMQQAGPAPGGALGGMMPMGPGQGPY